MKTEPGFILLYLVVEICCATIIHNGKCLDDEPYTRKMFKHIKECMKDCSVNIQCQAIVFERASRVCNIYETHTSVMECPGNYLVLRSDMLKVQYWVSFFNMFMLFSTPVNSQLFYDIFESH